MSNQKKSHFVGNYVSELRDVLIASAVTGQHAVVISEPGWGKTDIAVDMAKRIAGEDRQNLIPLSPTATPSLIEGRTDRQAWIEQGSYQLDRSGTPYDEELRIAVVDEFSRANDAVYDAMLHAVDPHKQEHCTVWATANWIPTGDRVQALIDRFAFWINLSPEDLDVEALIESQLLGKPTVAGDMPTWEQIERVREMKPTKQALYTVRDYLGMLVEEAKRQNLKVHPRLLTQWSKILFRMNAYVTGTNDFNMIEKQAADVLRYAFPGTEEEQAIWKQIVQSASDPVGAAIEAIMEDAYGEFSRVSAIDDERSRTMESGILAKFMTDRQRDLQEQFGDDPRVQKARERLSEWFGDAVSGKKPSYNS